MEFPDWTRAYVMMGAAPAGWKEVLLAPDGSMYALLQGETAAGALQTVRLDSEGRMSAFVIDSVDAWGRMLSIGNAELAVRLGSSMNYDRRGQVLFLETFENGLYRWEPLEGGVGADVSLTPTTAFQGGYSIKVTGGKDATQYAGIYRVSASRPVGKIGLEFSLAMSTPWEYVQVSLFLYTGAVVLTSEFRWIYTDSVLQVRDHPDGFVPVGTGKSLGESAKAFNTIKFVVDTDEVEWVRLMFNQQQIPVNTYQIISDADLITAPSIEVYIEIYSRYNYNDVMYVDNIILTGGEPE